MLPILSSSNYIHAPYGIIFLMWKNIGEIDKIFGCYCYYHVYQFGTGRHTRKVNKACKGVYL